jgi:hypothetical protein
MACASACGDSSSATPGSNPDGGAGSDATTSPPGEAGTPTGPAGEAGAPREGGSAGEAGAPGETSVGEASSGNEGETGCGDACPPQPAPFVDVLTQHYDNLRSGANLGETVLTTANVASLRQLFTATVDGEIYAQPLYAHGVSTEGGTRNLLFVESMEDTAFAFDADDGTPVWEAHLGTPAFSARNVNGDNGILATPVIDRSTETIYMVVRDCDPAQPATAPSCVQRLVALNLQDGSTRQTVAIQGSVTGDAGAVTFDPNSQWCRSGLLLENGSVYVAFAAGPNGNQHEEDIVFHGWVFGYAASQLSQAPSIYCSTPNGNGGGIWESGTGLAADGDSVYFATGNGIIGTTTNAPSVFPAQPEGNEDSLVKLTQPGSQATVSTYYDSRPYLSAGNVFQYMESNDIDLGASGPMLIPGTNQVVTSGKSGIVYNVARDTMTATQAPLSVFTNPPLASGQTLYIYSYSGGPKVNGGPVFWAPSAADGGAASGLIYIWPQNDFLKGLRYDFASGTISGSSWLAAANPITSVGGLLSLSANGGASGTGLLWALSTAASGSGHVWAFDAETLTSLWDVDIPHNAKFVPPVVANGKVYVANSAPQTSDPKSVIVFGL